MVAPVPAARADPRATGRPRTHRDRQGVRAAEPRLAALAAGWRTRPPVLLVVGDSREQRAGGPLRCRARNDSRARRAAPRRPHAAGRRQPKGLPADPASDGHGRGHRGTAAEPAAGVVRDRPEPGAGAARTPGQRQDDGAVAGHRSALGRARPLRHLVGAAETQRRGTAGGLRAVDEPGPRDGLPDADRRDYRRGRAPDTAGRKPEETRPCDREGRRPRTPPVERPRCSRVRRSPRAAARQRRRRRGRQRRRREAGGAAPGGVPPAAGQRAGDRRGYGEDAPAVVGEGARERPRGDIPRAGGRRGRRAPALQRGPAGGDGVRPSRRRRGAGPDPDRVLDAARAAPGMPPAHGQEPVAADTPGTPGSGSRPAASSGDATPSC